MFNMRVALLAVSMLLSAWLCGCGGTSGPVSATTSNNSVTSVARTYINLQFVLTADKSVYKVSEAIHLTLTAKNISAQSISYSASYPIADAVVTQQSQDVWQFSLTGGGGGSLANGVLQPGGTATFTFTWDQTRQSDGTQASPGLYTLTSWFNPSTLNGSTVESSRTNLASNSIQITLQSQ